jgi:hypothetical protein
VRVRNQISPAHLAEIKSRVSFAALVAERIPISRCGHNFVALCPFHSERTPSFRIYRDHGHCFGCGWHGDQLRWLIDYGRLGFLGAVRALCQSSGLGEPIGTDLDLVPREAECEWRPVVPILENASLFVVGRSARVFNPKREGERWEWATWRPAMVHPYRGHNGSLFGYVLRVERLDGGKFTPTVTYCENSAGERRWCLVPFPKPTPLYGLDRLAARPAAVALLVEGEKTADAAQRLFSSSAAITWAGGSNGHRNVDFTPLRGRKVVCIPDADQPGREAFYGRRNRAGKWVPGILEELDAVSAITRVADPEPERPDGWDLADAEAEGWSTPAALDWLRNRITEARNAA